MTKPSICPINSIPNAVPIVEEQGEFVYLEYQLDDINNTKKEERQRKQSYVTPSLRYSKPTLPNEAESKYSPYSARIYLLRYNSSNCSHDGAFPDQTRKKLFQSPY